MERILNVSKADINVLVERAKGVKRGLPVITPSYGRKLCPTRHGCFFRYEYVIVAGGAEGLADGLIDYVVDAAFADLLRRDVGVADVGSAYLNVGYGDGRTEGGVCIFIRGSAQDC